MGQYIANAVELVVFNKPSPLVDVNMSRVLERLFGPRKMADIRYDPYLQELAKEVVKHPRTKEINWAILDFAALCCKVEVDLYPNPFSSVLNIELPGAASVTVFNLMGEKVYENLSVASHISIDLGVNASGIYYVQVKTPTRSLTKKIVKE